MTAAGPTPDPRALLGAWALDALDDDERDAVVAAIGSDPAIAAEADELLAAAADLGETLVSEGSQAWRESLLARVQAAPEPRTAAPADPIDSYARQVAALSALLDDLTPADFDRRAVPYEWSVHGLLAHLLVIERYTAGQLGLRDPYGGPDTGDHLRLGAADIARELDGEPGATIARWRAEAERIVDAARTGRVQMDGPVDFHGWPLSVAMLLTARAFELWIHTDDMRWAVGRPPAPPSPPDLRAMSTMSVTSLPLLLGIGAPDVTMAPTRIVLTGAGGGTFDLPGAGSARALTLVADVVDYCRVVARRIEPEDLDATVQGEQALAQGLLTASRLLAI